MSYTIRTHHPLLVHQAACEFDSEIQHTADIVNNLHTNDKNKQDNIHTQNSLRKSVGGLGLRPALRTCYSAYVSSLLSIIPDIIQLFPDQDHAKSTTHEEIVFCLKELQQQGVDVDHFLKEVVTAKVPNHLTVSFTNIHQLWNIFSAQGSTRMNRNHTKQRGNRTPGRQQSHVPDISIPANHLQHYLTEQVEKRVLRDLLARLPRADRARLCALSRANANRYLSVVPFIPEYSIPDIQFREAIRFRVGLSPAGCEHESCQCSVAKALPDNHTFTHDPAHMHSCV
jgi:hypothetical protein